MANYAPIDEAWPQTDEESTYRSTYAVYGAQPRPQLHRPEPQTCGPIGFQPHNILPATFQSTPELPYNAVTPERQVSPRPLPDPKVKARSEPNVDIDLDYDDFGQCIQPLRTPRKCTLVFNHLRDCRRCREYCREYYMAPPSGMFWWLETRDAFIMIGGLIALVLAGILIKRG